MRHFNRKATITILSLLLALILPLSTVAAKPSDLTSFWTLDLKGNEVTHAVFAPYKLTMVNIWATFCPPCLEEMPALAQLRTEYKDKGVNIIGIVTDVYSTNQTVFTKNRATANLIIQKTGADYPHLLPSEDLVKARLQYSQAVPETFFVDNLGRIVGETYVGSRTKAVWKSVIDKTLAGL
jgi:thiol-disulfide isomerase/thioredoxin